MTSFNVGSTSSFETGLFNYGDVTEIPSLKIHVLASLGEYLHLISRELASLGELRLEFYPKIGILEKEETIEHEISTHTLMEAIRTDWNEIRDKVKELLRSYDVSVERADQVISEIKEHVRSMLKEFPAEDQDWLTEVLSKLYIRLAYELLCVE